MFAETSSARMREWIRERIEDLPPSTSFKLVHASAAPEVVQTFLVDGDNLELTTHRIAEQITSGASEHAGSFTSAQRYRVAAIGGDGTELGNHAFRVEPPNGGMALMDHEPEWPTEREPPTDTGLQAQLMRHLEKLHSNSMMMFESVVGNLVSENQSLRSNQRAIEEARIEYMIKLEKLGSLKHERDLEERREAHEQVLKEKVLEKGLLFLPDVIRGVLKHAGLDTKSLPEAKNVVGANGGNSTSSTNGANGSSTEETIALYQAKLARVVKGAGGYREIREALDEENHPTLENLLGLGDDYTDLTEYRTDVRRMIEVLNPDFVAKLARELPSEEAVVLAELVRE